MIEMVTSTGEATAVEQAVARLDGWLDSMRGPAGYGGPVVHWWRDCLVFCGAGLDWRYEGIVAGYLTLAERTGDACWLDKARRAGDDLLAGQAPDGHFRHSRFELNPGVAGTPHEASADIALLLLARALRVRGDEGWRRPLEAAATNVRTFYLSSLWSESDRRFWDKIGVRSFVPNKAATAIEALLLLAELTDDESLVERYVRPTADAILGYQVRSAGGPLDGAIAQSVLGSTVVKTYLPYYQARCASGLLAAYERLRDGRYLDGAIEAMRFAWRWRDADGAFPQVIYADRSTNRYPRWIAANGDLLRVARLLRRHGVDLPIEPTLSWLLAGRLPSGGIRTASGFAAQATQRDTGRTPELRDVLPVCGWADKAFRYLTSCIDRVPDVTDAPRPYTVACQFRGRMAELYEDERSIELRHRGRVAYRWTKGDTWADVRAPWAVTA